MKRFRLPAVTGIVLALALLTAMSAAARPLNFRTHLSGGQEVPPVVTQAQGQAIFQVNSAGDAMRFKLIVANIEDVFAAHIHCAPAGVNGPVGVTLFFVPPTDPVSVNGILSQDTITAPDDGNTCGWETLADVVTAIQSGDTYVNVHTTANTGGEIRGQIH